MFLWRDEIMETWIRQQQLQGNASVNNMSVALVNASVELPATNVPGGRLLRDLSTWSWTELFDNDGCNGNGTSTDLQLPSSESSLDYTMLYGDPLFWLYLVGESLCSGLLSAVTFGPPTPMEPTIRLRRYQNLNSPQSLHPT